MRRRPPPGRGAGEYDNFGTIQTNDPDTTGSGQLAQDWTGKPLGKAWFQIVPRGGREKRVFEQLRAEISHIVRTRLNSMTTQIMPAVNRLYFPATKLRSALTLNIESKIEIDARGVELQFECIEVQQ